MRLLPLAAALGLIPALLSFPSAGQPGAQTGQRAECTLQAGPAQAVVRVIDAETLLLDDNREVRLIGALAPRSPDMRSGARPWPPEQQTIEVLRDLVLGRSVELAYGGRRRDRYGRLLAHLFLDRAGERVWVQGQLLSSGHARAYGLPGSFACMRELLAHERAGREAQAGLWSNAAYAVRPAWRTRALMRMRNTYQIVEGRVLRVASSKSTTYLNFGRDWRRDFTAGVAAGTARAHAQWAKTLASLEGRRVEVRGWIEYRNGPYIRIEHPSQIAILEAEPRPSEPAPGAPTVSSDPKEMPPRQKQERPAQKKPGALDL